MAAASVWKTAVLSRGCRPSSVAAQRSVTRMGVRLLQHSSRALRGSSSKDDEEREAYLNRLESIGLETMEEPWELIDTLKLGRRQSTYNNKSSSMRRYHVCNAYWVASILDPKDKIPDLTPLRPEVAIAGRSNCGKSSLLNAMSGVKPALGIAGTSARPGWTRSINFYEISQARDHQEVFMVLVDLPGYGPVHSSVSAKDQLVWKRLINRYLKERERLISVFVLIESAAGVTDDDHAFMDKLDQLQRPFFVVITKADVLTPLQLAQSYTAIWHDVTTRHPAFVQVEMPMCSSRNGTGIIDLYKRLHKGTMQWLVEHLPEQYSHDA
uniref:EngB-type G domain-containing protein n=1 Tax=Chrysotila carterae TaxID=13221 RepID=A0A7S4F9G5_CHRCT|mmetsp:Transcript_21769/g.45979  ORF Transcript_21769/g.45979 Transcript_21769/m.45979 type:complete len:325 (+) Transcript_21769:25-999(+)